MGYLSDRSGSLKLAVLVLPAALLVGGALWLGLGLKTLYRHRRQAPGVRESFHVIKQQPAQP